MDHLNICFGMASDPGRQDRQNRVAREAEQGANDKPRLCPALTSNKHRPAVQARVAAQATSSKHQSLSSSSNTTDA